MNLTFKVVLICVNLAYLMFVGANCLGTEPAGESEQNVVLITMDGMRLEEIFNGADSRLILPELGCKDVDQLVQTYCRETSEQSRKILMPFLWQQVEQAGWIAGDRSLNSVVQVTNGHNFSYPGYSELLTGKADDWVDSNDKRYNRNVTVLEFLNRLPELNGKVSAYCSWDVFPYIINDQRSGILVNAGWARIEKGNEHAAAAANFLAEDLFHEWEGVRYDAFTMLAAVEAIKEDQPRVVFVALGETDDWAHAGRYDRYLLAAQQNDRLIRKLWEACQSLEQYRDKTTFIVTSDHGRGSGREEWKSHSAKLPGSEFIWVAAFGAQLQARGIDHDRRFTQSQVAATVADTLGYKLQEFNAEAAPPLPIMQKATSE